MKINKNQISFTLLSFLFYQPVSELFHGHGGIQNLNIIKQGYFLHLQIVAVTCHLCLKAVHTQHCLQIFIANVVIHFIFPRRDVLCFPAAIMLNGKHLYKQPVISTQSQFGWSKFVNQLHTCWLQLHDFVPNSIKTRL